MNKFLSYGIGLVVVLLIVFLIVISFCGVNNSKIIKVGAILPLSGNNAYIGEDLKKGIELAIQDSNDPIVLEIIYEDCAGSPVQAVNAYNLLKQKGVSMVVTAMSNITLAIAPLAESDKMPVFTIAVATSILNSGDYVFVNNFIGEEDINYLLQYISNKFDYNNLAIIASEAEFGKQYLGILEKGWKAEGKKVVLKEVYPLNNVDFATIILKLKDANPDVVYMIGYASELSEILIELKKQDVNLPVFSYWGAQEQTIINAAKIAAEGLIVTSSPFDEKTEPIFFKMFNEKYGYNPNYRAGLAYDIIKMYYYVGNICGSNKECIKTELYKIKDFNGVTGLTTIVSDGGTLKPFAIWQVKDGQFVKYE